MPQYRVLVSVPLMFHRLVKLDANDQAEAIGEALDEAVKRAHAQKSPDGEFVASEEPATVVYCTRDDATLAPLEQRGRDVSQNQSSANFSVLYFDEPLTGVSMVTRSREELQALRLRAVSVLEAETKAQAVALASLVLENTDPRRAALVVDGSSILHSVVNPYGGVALVAYDAPEDAAARNDSWRLLEGWQPSVGTARRKAVAILEQGYVRAIGIAVRNENDPARKGLLQVVAVLQDA
jgi:tRNA pseudouridine-54 N-methylase